MQEPSASGYRAEHFNSRTIGGFVWRRFSLKRGEKMKRTSHWLIMMVALLLAWASVQAQELATLKVTVNDQTGAVVPGATVTLKNTATGAKRTDVTESNGLAVIPGIPPGSYEMAA